MFYDQTSSGHKGLLKFAAGNSKLTFQELFGWAVSLPQQFLWFKEVYKLIRPSFHLKENNSSLPKASKLRCQPQLEQMFALSNWIIH